MNHFTFRPARKDDIDAIVDFNTRLALETEDRILDPETLRKGVMAVLSDSSKGRYFVATVGEVVAGQLMVTFEWSDWRNGNFWWVQSVYVRAEFRGQSVLRGLVAHVRERAGAEKNVCGLRLYVEKENHRAQQAYERLGIKQAAYEVFEDDFVFGRPA